MRFSRSIRCLYRRTSRQIGWRDHYRWHLGRGLWPQIAGILLVCAVVMVGLQASPALSKGRTSFAVPQAQGGSGALVPNIDGAIAPSSDAKGSSGQPSVESAPAAPAFQVAPVVLNQKFDPGTTATLGVTVRNNATAAMGMRVTPAAFAPGQAIDTGYAKAFDAAAWFEVPQAEFLLTPGESRSISLEVSIPEKAEPGGHYATIYFQSYVPQPENFLAAAELSLRIGVQAFLTVSGELSERGSLTPMKVGSLQLAAEPTPLEVGIRNEGNVHVLPNGYVTIRDFLGKSVKTLPLPTGFVLPGTTRTYPITWEHGLRFGPHRVQAHVRYGSAQTELVSTVATVWFVPMVVVVPLVLLTLGLLLAFVALRRVRKRNRQRSFARSLLLPPMPSEGEVATTDGVRGAGEAGERDEAGKTSEAGEVWPSAKGSVSPIAPAFPEDLIGPSKARKPTSLRPGDGPPIPPPLAAESPTDQQSENGPDPESRERNSP